ncbi:MAG: L,D-transpeptidase family protein [Steroidobacteraceae bacterium]|jgi:murein L,D-transpeptidase YafK
MPPQAPEFRIVIEKAARRLRLYSGPAALREYRIAIGRNIGADKAVEGDEATPLGEFFICARNPHSRFFRSLCISYPNTRHADRGLRAGLIDAREYAQIIEAIEQLRTPPQDTRLGGEIYIHGEAPGRCDEGTRGCIAVNNQAMQELFELVPLGTPVSIEP